MADVTESYGMHLDLKSFKIELKKNCLHRFIIKINQKSGLGLCTTDFLNFHNIF